MASVDTQNIPSELKDKYAAALQGGPNPYNDWTVSQRHPFRIPMLQGCRTIRPPIPKGSKVSFAMCQNRELFGDCVKCFQKQLKTGGVEPPDIGPRNRSWWFDEAIGKLPWYYNYFMYETMNAYIAGEPPDWCKIQGLGSTYISEDNPDTRYGTSVYLRVYNYLTGRIDSILKAPAMGYGGLHFYIHSYSKPVDTDKVVMYAYEIEEDFDLGDMTWNKRPQYGAQVGVRTIRLPEDKETWKRISTGGKTGVALTLVGAQEAQIRITSDTTAPNWPCWI